VPDDPLAIASDSILRIRVDHVSAPTAVDPVSESVPGENRVGAVTRIDHVLAQAGMDQVDAAAAADPVGKAGSVDAASTPIPCRAPTWRVPGLERLSR
jgi:hypothetical protein